jgi:GWxTD domain-containing protein
MRRAVLAAALLLLAGCNAGPPRARTAAELNNTRLSPALSQWLIGAVSKLATPEEVQGYLALTDDAAATAFIEAFWAAHDPDPARPGNPLRELFERRALEADKRFSEAGYLGRRTDRGTLFVLYGEPKTIDFELNPREGDPPVELWSYGGARGPALDGKLPSPVYRFVKRGDLTVIFQQPLSEQILLPPGA